ncbi:MAG TPA: hypothetical protein VGE67_18775 [Haloferula sp.]
MMTTRLLLATFSLAIALPTTLNAEVKAPTLRTTSEWLVISGYRDNGNGALPWTFALKKSSIKSISIWTDLSKHPSENLKDITPEQIENLPASIYIVTDELDSSGANSRFEITGLTNASAPAMLEKLLDAASDSTASTPAK